MVPHLEYLWYVIRHKWFVFLAGRKTRAPLWRLIIHDWSKFSSAEWSPYVENFYCPLDPSIGRGEGQTGVELVEDLKRDRQERFNRAWLHHQHRNPHHWQHWVLREDDGDTVALQMPCDLAREMLADWMGAGRAITGEWEVASWYEKNRDKIILHPDTRQFIEILMNSLS